MIKSEIERGLIHAGNTALTCTLSLEQTGPMQLTVRAGTLVMPDGTAITLAADEALDITADPVLPRYYRIEVGMLDGAANVLCRSRLEPEFPAKPAGWVRVHTLTIQGGTPECWGSHWEFAVPPGTTDLSALDIYALSVLPGFPEVT